MATFEELYNSGITPASLYDKNLAARTLSSDVDKNGRFTRYGDKYRFYDDRNSKQGVFSANNPYLTALATTVHDSDLAAIFEMATKWEADRANLEEQRDYESPLSELQRQRQAGINPDLSGSSSASGGSSSSAMPPASSDIRMGNPMDEAQMDALKHQTVIGYVNSAVNLATGIIGGISQLSMLPSQLAISKAGAQVATATVDDSIQMVSEQLKAQKLNNASQLISNTSATAAHIGSLSQMFTPETSDEDMSAILTALGTPKDMIAPYTSAIRQAQSNPNVQAYFSQGERQAREARAYNDVYTPAVVLQITENAFKYQLLKQQTDIATQSLEKLVADALNTEQNAENISSSLSLGYEADKNSEKLRLRQAKHDVDVFDYQCKQLASIVLDIRTKKQELRERTQNREKNNGTFTVMEQAYYDSLSIMEQQLLGLGSSAVGNAMLILSKVYQNRAVLDYNIDLNGNLRDTYQEFGPGNKFIDATFSNSYFDTENPFTVGAKVGAGVGSMLWKVIKFAITKKP